MSDWLERDLNYEYSEEDWYSINNPEYIPKKDDVENLVSSFTKSKMSDPIFARSDSHSHTMMIGISGGLNGPGKWTDYLQDIKELFDALNNIYKDVWLVKLDNDCLDDVWYLVVDVLVD